MRDIVFTIPGRIGGKQRAGRQFLGGGKVRSFNPAKTASQEAIVRHFAAQEMRGEALLTGAVFMHIFVFRHSPTSWSKKKRDTTPWITSKPDWDNIGKLISDALNGVVWIDDAQVASAQVTKLYMNDGPECVTVMIAELP